MLRIEFSQKAVERLTDIFVYCSENFGKIVAEDILQKYNDTILLLSKFPEMGIKENNKYRSFPVNNLGRILYSVEKETLQIKTILDLRSNYKINTEF
ncbi:MAG: type II toxin-antitoxin system RelE/ParE family toxin [Bacteroidales bacterium]|nr:type II toxin-antitoxin system RelE/ParE family toxin [Bacteroidales bacterium]